MGSHGPGLRDRETTHSLLRWPIGQIWRCAPRADVVSSRATGPQLGVTSLVGVADSRYHAPTNEVTPTKTSRGPRKRETNRETTSAPRFAHAYGTPFVTKVDPTSKSFDLTSNSGQSFDLTSKSFAPYVESFDLTSKVEFRPYIEKVSTLRFDLTLKISTLRRNFRPYVDFTSTRAHDERRRRALPCVQPRSHSVFSLLSGDETRSAKTVLCHGCCRAIGLDLILQWTLQIFEICWYRQYGVADEQLSEYTVDRLERAIRNVGNFRDLLNGALDVDDAETLRSLLTMQVGDYWSTPAGPSGSATVSTVAWPPNFAVKTATPCTRAVQSVKSSSMAREELLHGCAIIASTSSPGSVKRGYARTCKCLFIDCVCSLESYQS